MAPIQTRDHTVDDRITIITQALSTNPALQQRLPGLHALLTDYLDPAQPDDPTDFLRRLLRVLRDSQADSTYQDWLGKLDDEHEEKQRIADFVDGRRDLREVCAGFVFGPSLGVREHLAKLGDADVVVVEGLNDKKKSVWREMLCGLVELCGGPSKGEFLVYRDAPFSNWGRDVEYRPALTCVPSTVAHVQRIVRYAKAKDLGVRCAGFRHSWSPIFGRTGQITISLIGLHDATKLPNFVAISKAMPQSTPTELESIDIVTNGPVQPRTQGNTLVRIGASTTNERLRRWCVANNKHTYPLNVIMVEITAGGSNAPICHGAGRRHATLSDLVRRVEYVDCHGQRRVVDDPAHLRAAAGAFGLLGVVTHLTLEFAPMTYALMAPRKLPVVRAVPPPEGYDVPAALQVAVTAEERARDIAAFEEQCNECYYVEYFWFPYADQAWVNNWNDTADGGGEVVDYPSDVETFFMFVAQFTVNVLQYSTVLQELIAAADLDTAAVTLISRAAMLAMPAWEEPKKMYLTDALHFQRGIQNVRVLDVEVEMPLLPQKDDASKPDYELVRRAWWDAILECYKHSDTSPQRMPLEMRIMGGSEIVMAPQRGNQLGTCAIEVLTLEDARDLWKPYAQGILDKWMGYVDSEGKPLRTRPHWAKQWDGFEVNGRPWTERMKQVDYKEELLEFRQLLEQIGQKDGWTLADIQKRFSNDFLDSFFFD